MEHTRERENVSLCTNASIERERGREVEREVERKRKRQTERDRERDRERERSMLFHAVRGLSPCRIEAGGQGALPHTTTSSPPSSQRCSALTASPLTTTNILSKRISAVLASCC